MGLSIPLRQATVRFATGLLVGLLAGGPVGVAAADESGESPRQMPMEQSESDGETDEPDGEEGDGEDVRDDELVLDRESQRRSLASMSRRELEERGFVFEDTLTQRERAHATLFALTAGGVVSGAGHWHLDDPGTAVTLLINDAVAVTLLGAGVFLAASPTGTAAVDDRRYDLWYLGTGLLGTSWLVDIFGTAYRDELGIPDSTRRDVGYGLSVRYHYWRPRGLSMRHVSVAEFFARGRHFDVRGKTAQELGLGMSEYELDARWFPFVGTTTQTRIGIGGSARYRHYRLDEPYRRTELGGYLHGSLNLGRVAGHLDQMTVGASAGLARRGGERSDEAFGSGARRWRVPVEMHLGLNLTEQLRLRAGFERASDHWLEQPGEPTPLGVPTGRLTYRSSDRLELQFFTSVGDGVGVGAGLRGWIGE